MAVGCITCGSHEGTLGPRECRDPTALREGSLPPSCPEGISYLSCSRCHLSEVRPCRCLVRIKTRRTAGEGRTAKFSCSCAHMCMCTCIRNAQCVHLIGREHLCTIPRAQLPSPSPRLSNPPRASPALIYPFTGRFPPPLGADVLVRHLGRCGRGRNRVAPRCLR